MALKIYGFSHFVDYRLGTCVCVWWWWGKWLWLLMLFLASSKSHNILSDCKWWCAHFCYLSNVKFSLYDTNSSMSLGLFQRLWNSFKNELRSWNNFKRLHQSDERFHLRFLFVNTEIVDSSLCYDCFDVSLWNLQTISIAWNRSKLTG